MSSAKPGSTTLSRAAEIWGSGRDGSTMAVLLTNSEACVAAAGVRSAARCAALSSGRVRAEVRLDVPRVEAEVAIFVALGRVDRAAGMSLVVTRILSSLGRTNTCAAEWRAHEDG